MERTPSLPTRLPEAVLRTFGPNLLAVDTCGRFDRDGHDAVGSASWMVTDTVCPVLVLLAGVGALAIGAWLLWRWYRRYTSPVVVKVQ